MTGRLLQQLRASWINVVLRSNGTRTAALLRVCSSLYTLLQPILCHTGELDIAEATRRESFFSSSSDHAYLRDLIIISNGDNQLLDSCMVRLICTIPRNTLRTLRCDTTSPGLRQLFFELVAAQDSLRNMLLTNEGESGLLSEASRDAYIARLEQQEQLTVAIKASLKCKQWFQPHGIYRELNPFRRSRCLSVVELAFEPESVGWPKISTRLNTFFILLLILAPNDTGYRFGPGYVLDDQFAPLTSMVLRRASFAAIERLDQQQRMALTRLTSLILQDCGQCSAMLDVVASYPGYSACKHWSLCRARMCRQSSTVH